MSAFDRIQTYSSSAVRSSTNTVAKLGDRASKYDLASPSDMLLAKIDAEGFNMDELTGVLKSDSDLLTISGAGSGKSTALIFKIMYDMESGRSMVNRSLPNGAVVQVPDKIWVSTFLKSGAEELEEKLGKWQYKFGYPVTNKSITFSTLHAEFKRALNAMGVATNMCSLDYKDSTNSSTILKRAVTKMGILPLEREKLTEDDYSAIESLVTNYRNRLDETRYEGLESLDLLITPTILDALVETFRLYRKDLNVMDFEDLQELLYRFLYITPNAAVQDFIANRYSFIYLDEFQDTSQIQYEILKFYARPRLTFNKNYLKVATISEGGTVADGLVSPYVVSSGRIIAIGDDDQSIYGWRGSDIRIITTWFERDFSPEVVQLTVNYRCPSNILNPVIQSIEKNLERHKKPLISSVEGGEFNFITSNNQFAMLKDMYERIERDVSNGLSVAVICRTNYDGVLPALMLEMKDKFSFSISGSNMSMSTSLPRKLLSMTSLFTERSSPSVKNALSMFVYHNCEWKVANMVKAMKADNTSIWNIDMGDVAYSCPELLPMLKTLRNLVIVEGERKRDSEIDALKYVYSWMYENSYAGDSVFCTSARLYISMLLFILDEVRFNSIFEFQEMMEVYNDGLKAKIKKQNTKVSIVTAHEYKGKEADSVYLWHDSMGTFPSSKCNLDSKSAVEEERRVHYIACTRARKIMTIYGLNSKLGLFARELNCVRQELLPKVTGKLGVNTQTSEVDLETSYKNA